jgi:hypothetical protein
MSDLGLTKSNTEWVRNGAHATTHLANNEDGESAAIVCIKVKPSYEGPQVAALLVHEAVHIWQKWCEMYGEANPGTEQEAYAIQFISSELFYAYTEKLK